MTLLETICALWLFAATALISVDAWGTSVRLLQMTAHQQIAQTCATDAAEQWLAGVDKPAVYSEEGQVCHVTVTPDDATQLVHVEAVCAGVQYELWIPTQSAP